MKLFNVKTIAAISVASVMALGTASAADQNSDADEPDTSAAPDAFINVKAAVASRFSVTNSSSGGLTTRQIAQKDLLNRSAELASNN